jgi:hypothetical protein
MGNSGLKQHLENSSKTGVFQLKDANLSEVNSDSLFTYQRIIMLITFFIHSYPQNYFKLLRH